MALPLVDLAKALTGSNLSLITSLLPNSFQGFPEWGIIKETGISEVIADMFHYLKGDCFHRYRRHGHFQKRALNFAIVLHNTSSNGSGLDCDKASAFRAVNIMQRFGYRPRSQTSRLVHRLIKYQSALYDIARSSNLSRFRFMDIASSFANVCESQLEINLDLLELLTEAKLVADPDGNRAQCLGYFTIGVKGTYQTQEAISYTAQKLINSKPRK